MKFKVHMLANEPAYRVREVDLPGITEDILSTYKEDTLLNEIYVYGQNDFQPQQCCSVSVGDIIELGDKMFLVASIGFQQLNLRQLLELLVKRTI